eukprot:CAMPEP_0170581438 /NCGR_PEP_ID=MMETSP0224-20130122/7038_1 /TAXON_ID=285029 /ORGANISM="Togula jolla, Strain CCCM 725" /LENGTH=466 /DNA_ID=CAMNT_0010904571 /DNA_START=80 /DNA_END=1480 /DNA_ORIENTATION=-
MQSVHAKLPARQSFLEDSEVKFAWNALDKDCSGKLTGDEVRTFFQAIFGYDVYKGGEVSNEYNPAQFKVMVEDLHRKHPQWNVAGKLMSFAKSQASAQAAPGPMGGPGTELKKALLVGINYLGSPNELGGCINDVRSEFKVLTEVFGFQPDNVLLLTEDQGNASKRPTCANIRNGLRWLFQGVKSGDFLFFAYSGHGSQMPDLTGTEEDGQNECICPIDCMEAPWPTNIILDDELNEIFHDKLPEGVKCLCIFDCCHSGSMEDLSCSLRPVAADDARNVADLTVVSRYMRPYGQAGKDIIPIAARQMGADAKPRAAASPQVSDHRKKLWVLSGCQDHQTSADATINGKRQGALTWSIMKALQDHQYTLTYDEMLKAVRTNLRGKYTQIPALSSTCESNFSITYLDGPTPEGLAKAARNKNFFESLQGLDSALQGMGMVVGGQNLNPTNIGLVLGGILVGLILKFLF